MNDDRDRVIARATGELRDYAETLDGYRRTVSGLVLAMHEAKVTPAMWGVHESFAALPANPNAPEPVSMSYAYPEAPAELVAFRVAYEAAHEALATRLWKLARAFEQDANTYRLIADQYDEDERENLAELDRVTIRDELPRDG